MKLLLDSNILFAALIRDSVVRKIILHFEDSEFYIISDNFKEFEKYEQELVNKSKVGQASFDVIKNQLIRNCILVEDKVLKDYWTKAKEIMDKTDPSDTPFIAAALATNSVIWSDDGHFKKQNHVKVLSTKELLELLKL